MKLIRVFTLMLIVFVALAPVAAQDLPELPIVFPETIAEGRDVSITVAACIGEDQTEQQANFDAQLARFMEVYPNVTVERTQYCFNPESFAALVAGSNLATLFEVPATEPARLIQQGVAADISAQFEALGLEGIYNPTLMALLSDADGNVYGFPGFSYAQGIGWDIEALKAGGYETGPTTWIELGEMAKALADAETGRAGFAMFLSGGGGGWHWTNLAYGFGATELIRDNGDGTYTAVYGEGPAVEAMQFLYDLRWPDAENALPRDLNSNPTFETVDGRSVIFMSPADGSIGWLRVNMPEVDLARFGYSAVPKAPDGKRYALTGGSYTMVFSGADDDQKEAAVVFQVWRNLSPAEFAPSREIFHSTQAGAGTPVLPIYTGDLQKAVDEFDKQFITMPVENYQGFYDALNAGELVLVPEPPFAQDFYVAISEVMTTVLTDESADVAQLMKDNAAAFQAGILDPAASK
jgi:ABC-type glycerol-3-phosphate transport system substrate-binding protein